MNHLTGGCTCLRVRYTVFSAPISQGICYCQQCKKYQKNNEMFGNPLLVLEKDSLTCSKEGLSFCTTTSDRGSIVSRYFCTQCGDHVFAQISDLPAIVTIRANTLDDFSVFAAEYLAWTASADSNSVFPSGVPAFSMNAPIELILKSYTLKM